jgi:probable rRNA maturation factor
MLQLEIQNPDQVELPDLEWLTQCAASAYQGEFDAPSAVLRVVGVEEGRSLNSSYREKDYATNILSFPSDFSDLPPEVLDEEDAAYLGDLVVCAEVVEKEALEQKKTKDQHWAHLLIHGVLHLQGYDHITEDEAAVMEAIEIKLLGELGIPDPYNETQEG